MIWHCKHCATWNANINDVCILCNISGSHKGHTDSDLQDIYLETIHWYMLAEVDRSRVVIEQLNDLVSGVDKNGSQISAKFHRRKEMQSLHIRA